MNRRHAELAASIVGCVVGGYFCLESMRLGVGQLSEPGPGMLPAAAGGLLTVLSLANAGALLLTNSDMAAIQVDRRLAAHVAYTIASIGLFAAAVPYTGFAAACSAMLLALFYGVAGLALPRALALTALVSAGTYVVFVMLLKVPLP